MSRRAGRGDPSPVFSLFLAATIFLISGAGCLWGRAAKGLPPSPPGEEDESYTQIEEAEPEPGSDAPESSEAASAPVSPGAGGDPDAAEKEAAGALSGTESVNPGTSQGDAGSDFPLTVALPEVSVGEASAAEPVSEPAMDSSGIPGEKAPAPAPSRTPPATAKGFTQLPSEVPAWALGKEVLVYRVEFLGMTMGYARFTFKGKVSIRGREAYHLNVRAWTSDFLSVIYPINDTIDYYLDVKTLAPLRQEFAHPQKAKDDVMTYDQETGKIVYRYKATGEIRKQVDTIPNVYDPVSAAYYFRFRDLGAENRPRNVYGGRKLYQISTRMVGQEKIAFSGKPIDTDIVQPVIKRDGRLDDKGDLRMWMTTDVRRIPVRIFAKFKKIRTWTLYAELMPPREGG